MNEFVNPVIEAKIETLYDKYNAGLPYHNFKHARNVAKRASELFNETVTILDESIELFMRTSLYLACLFHDLGYSLNAKSDRENVEQAVVLFRKFAEDNNVAAG